MLFKPLPASPKGRRAWRAENKRNDLEANDQIWI